MGRGARSDLPGTWFHIVNRGVARSNIFLTDRDRVEFGRLLGEANDRWGIRIHAYCLMSNHYHLLLEGSVEAMSNAMHHVGGVFARHLNERIGRDGPVFRSRYFSRPVLSEEYLLRLVRYIHRNPVVIVGEAGLETYRWSSYRTYLGYRRAPHWMSLDAVSELCGGVEGLRSLTVGGHGGGNIVGPSDLRSAVDFVVDEHIEAPSQGVARTVLALVAGSADVRARQAAVSLLALRSPAAVSSAKSRAKRRATVDPNLRTAAAELIRLVA